MVMVQPAGEEGEEEEEGDTGLEEAGDFNPDFLDAFALCTACLSQSQR